MCVCNGECRGNAKVRAGTFNPFLRASLPTVAGTRAASAVLRHISTPPCPPTLNMPNPHAFAPPSYVLVSIQMCTVVLFGLVWRA